jgi:hypothetical protein
MSLRAALVFAVVATVAAAEAPAPAGGALARAVPVAIESRALDTRARTFRLTYLTPTEAREDGSATLVVHRASGVELEGTETFLSARGTLMFHWIGRRVAGRRLRGGWAIVGSTGVFAGRGGHGAFRANDSFAVIEYRGLLVIAA